MRERQYVGLSEGFWPYANFCYVLTLDPNPWERDHLICDYFASLKILSLPDYFNLP